LTPPLLFFLIPLFAVPLYFSGDVFTILRWLAGGPWSAAGVVVGAWAVVAGVGWWASRASPSVWSRRALLGTGVLVGVYLGTGAVLARRPEARIYTLQRLSLRADIPTPLLRRVLTDDSPKVRGYVILCLFFDGKRPAAEVVPVVRPILADPREDTDVVLYGVGGLCSLGGQAAPAVPELIGLLHRPEREVVVQAAALLGFIGPPAKDAIPVLLDRLRSPPSASVDPIWLRMEIATALWRIDPPGAGQEGADYFIATLDASDAGSRRVARTNLRLLDPQTRKRAVPALRRQLALQPADPLEWADALYQADPTTAAEILPLVIAELQRDNGPHPIFADRAVALAGRMGPDAKAALPALRQLRRRVTENEWFRGEIGWTMLAIDPNEPLD
jgi:hypothetical protein